MTNNNNNLDKKYYFLKLNKEFFKRHDIAYIESQKDGLYMSLLYIKLLAESVDHVGRLRFSEKIPYTNAMLVAVCGLHLLDNGLDIVNRAMELFVELELVRYEKDKTIIMVKAEEMMSGNTSTARSRRWREKQKELQDNKIDNDNSDDEKQHDNDSGENVDETLQERDSNDVNDEQEEDEQPIKKNKKSTSKKNTMPNYSDELFNRFWESYPRKVGKPKCFNWFKSHKVTEEFLEEVVKALELQKTSVDWNKIGRDDGVKGAYIPHPLTWLNRGGWNDELQYAQPIDIEQKISKRWENFIDER